MKVKKLIVMVLSVALAMPCFGTAGKEVCAAESSADVDSVDYAVVTSLDGFRDYINRDGAYSSQDTINRSVSDYGSVHKFTVDEEGWIFIYGLGTNTTLAYVSLYSNQSLSNRLDHRSITNNASGTPVANYVEAGTYYYQVSDSCSYKHDNTYTVFVGFLPASSRVSIESIKYSDDNLYATVTLNCDQSYVPNTTDATIRLSSGYVSVTKHSDTTAWDTYSDKNKVDYTFTVTENGEYTVRVANTNADKYFCYARFKIEGLGKSSESGTYTNDDKVPSVQIKTAKRRRRVKRQLKVQVLPTLQ